VLVRTAYVVLTPATATVSETVRVGGRLPGVGLRRVWAQRQAEASWVNMGSTTTSAGGSYAVAVKAPAGGSYAVRVYAPKVLVAGRVRAQFVTLARSLTSVPPPGPAGSGLLGYYEASTRWVTTACASGPEGRRVLVVGDSITVHNRVDLESALTAAGWAVCLDARSGQPTSAALDYYAAEGSFPAYVDVVVMATGSNDIFDPARLPEQVARARAYAGTRPLLWVSAWVDRPGVAADYRAHDLPNSVRVNYTVTPRSGWQDVTDVVDWYGFLLAKPSRQVAYLIDGVHTSVMGAVARSALIGQKLAPYLR